MSKNAEVERKKKLMRLFCCIERVFIRFSWLWLKLIFSIIVLNVHACPMKLRCIFLYCWALILVLERKDFYPSRVKVWLRDLISGTMKGLKLYWLRQWTYLVDDSFTDGWGAAAKFSANCARKYYYDSGTGWPHCSSNRSRSNLCSSNRSFGRLVAEFVKRALRDERVDYLMHTISGLRIFCRRLRNAGHENGLGRSYKHDWITLNACEYQRTWG